MRERSSSALPPSRLISPRGPFSVERSGERFYAAELQRQQGALLLATGDDPALAARCFEAAVEIARQQDARALERRALQDLDEALSRAR